MSEKPEPDFTMESLLREIRPKDLLPFYDGPGAYTAEELAEEEHVRKKTLADWAAEALKPEGTVMRVRIKRDGKMYKGYVKRKVYEAHKLNLTNIE